jgi:RNA 2',3'-cyclic 3'-phosphodiesterase
LPEDAIDAPWRLFLAVPLPEDVKALVAELAASLGAEGWPVRWVQPAGAHLTLHFLGETPPERAQLLRLALPGAVATHAPFDLRTAAFGVFPNFRAPRVLWLGLHGPVHRLETLQRELGRTLAELEFPVGDEPYHPHITLGRLRNSDGFGMKAQSRDIAEAIKGRFVDSATGAAVAPSSRPVPVREVLLMRSHLGREGARYETIAAFPLRGEPAP